MFFADNVVLADVNGTGLIEDWVVDTNLKVKVLDLTRPVAQV
jgi:hypothetical protein